MLKYSPKVVLMKSLKRLSLFYIVFWLFIFSGIGQTVPQGFKLVAYEGFDYSSGSSIRNAAGGTGWTNPWMKSYMDRFLKTSTMGFTYPGLTATGLKAEFDNACYGSCNAIASLRRTLPLQNKGIVYFQFISVFETNGGGGTPSIRLFSEGTLTGGIGSSGGSFMSLLDATLSNTATSTSSLNAQNLVVVRIDYTLNKTEMWINPNLSTFDYSNPTNPAATKLGFAPSFDRFDIFIRSGSIDEITIFSQFSPFITTWQTNATNSITIPLNGGGYDFTIDWGDGTIETHTGSPGNINHIYTTAGVKTVRITPNIETGFPTFFLNNNAELRNNLLTIESWGSGKWGSSLERAFLGASNLEVYATDVPDFSLTTNFSSMFQNCTSLTGNAGFTNWILNTDPSASVSFVRMFHSTTNFNGDLSNWNVSRVTAMQEVFRDAIIFNQNIDNWNVGNVTNMSNMFNNAKAFNQNISNWDVSKVTQMIGMFQSAVAFNSPLNWGNNTANVTNMSNMFFGASVFNQALNSWDVSNVTTMASMFYNAIAFNSPLDWGNKTAKITFINHMFYGAIAFDQDLGSWDISNVTNMFYFLFNGKLSRKNYDNTLRGWSTLDPGETKIPTNLNVHFGTSNYSNNNSVVDARTDLTGSRSWVITDGGMVSVLTTNGELSGSYTININKNGGLGGSAAVSKNGKIID